MKTESNFSLPRSSIIGFGAAFAVVLGACFACPAGAIAGEAYGAVPNQPIGLSAPPSMPPGAAPVNSFPPGVQLQDPGKPPEDTIEKNMIKSEDKVIENAKNAVKSLDTVSDEATLAEMNHTRQAISRIDAMIDVEKRLGELEKLRNERNHISAMPPALAAAIPMSALKNPNPPPQESEEQKEMRRAPTHPNLVRIFGTNGKYTAVLKFTGENVKMLKIGDKVSDGETVRGITSSSVEIGGKEKSYTLRVKNVDVVYSVVH
jgi:type IV pilus biogenesis protein PilP